MPHHRKQLECRRRTGCFQCKEKHLRCTEERPRCRRCQKLGLDCARGLRLVFREDAIQRGIHFGREGTWTKRPLSTKTKTPTEVEVKSGESFRAVSLDAYRGRWEFLNFTYDDFSSEKSPMQDRITEETALLEGQPATNLTDVAVVSLPFMPNAIGHPLSLYTEIESYLLSYFIVEIGPNCSLSLSYNPYISLIMPMCFRHTTLRNALLAVAANQLRLLGHVEFEKEACLFKDRALHGLQQAIITDSLDYGAIGTVLMLCFHDISDGCSPSWVTHLRGGLKLIHYVSSRSNDSELLLLKRFFTMYFVAHDIMSRTASEKLYEHPIASSWLEVDDLDEIDVIMGCSRNLMTLIDKISAMASEKQRILRSRPLSEIEVECFVSARNEIETSLRFLKQTLPSHSAERSDLEHVAETKRLAALLYLGERLDVRPDFANDICPRTSDSGTEAAPALERPRKRHLVSSLIHSISTLPHSATLLWPLYVLGNTGLDNEDHRRFVLDRLENIQKTRNLGSVRRARLAVKRAFRARDLDYPGGRIWGDHESGFISLA